jgi:hypothetical protein
MEKKIFSDDEVFEQIKPASRKAYKKCWKKYISSSMPAILGMASRLGGFKTISEHPLVEVDVEMDMEMEKDPLDIKPIMQEIEEYIVLEEDPEMYAMDGMELVSVPGPVKGRIE